MTLCLNLQHDILEVWLQILLFFSYPLTIKDNGDYEVVPNLSISDWARSKMELTEKELIEEQNMALEICKG